jgi:hypothetical protein
VKNSLKTVLAENEKEVLLKLDDIVELDGKNYKMLRYEWWVNKEKMEQRIHGDGRYIYCKGYAGVDEKELIKRFNNKNFDQEFDCLNLHEGENER